MSRRGSGMLLALGVALLLCAGALAGYNMWKDAAAGGRARDVLTLARAAQAADPSGGEGASGSLTLPVDSPAATQDAPKGPEAAAGYEAVGVVSIPRLDVELAVLGDLSDALLDVSVCRYQGEALGGPDRLVIAGHSYKTHFGSIPRLEAGDSVIFTDMSGTEYPCVVTATETIDGTDFEGLERGEWDMTLFTCTYDGSGRILVRCGAVGGG